MDLRFEAAALVAQKQHEIFQTRCLEFVGESCCLPVELGHVVVVLYFAVGDCSFSFGSEVVQYSRCHCWHFECL